MESLRLYLHKVNTFIGSSTFGRVFRLEGCGHVKFALWRETYQLLMVIGKRDQEFKVHDRNPCWPDNVLHNGIRHICQCMYSPDKVGNSADTQRLLS